MIVLGKFLLCIYFYYASVTLLVVFALWWIMGCFNSRTSTSTGDSNNFGKSLLAASNKLRAKHGSSPLKWSSIAANKAKEWADHLAKSGTLQHGNHEGMGQNLAYKMGQELTGEDVANMWYEEISDYNFDHPGFKSGTGHFTQMVWASTTQMGAAIVTQGNRSYAVANYIPPGNITNEGQFELNVRRPK